MSETVKSKAEIAGLFSDSLTRTINPEAFRNLTRFLLGTEVLLTSDRVADIYNMGTSEAAECSTTPWATEATGDDWKPTIATSTNIRRIQIDSAGTYLVGAGGKIKSEDGATYGGVFSLRRYASGGSYVETLATSAYMEAEDRWGGFCVSWAGILDPGDTVRLFLKTTSGGSTQIWTPADGGWFFAWRLC